jgi:hypothetical protein
MKEKKILEEIARFREISKIDNEELVNEGVLGDILKAILFGDKDLSWEEILDRFFKKVKEKKLLSKVDVDFKEMTKMVIDKLEGGYYNPKWHYKPQMGRSGETMFGIDRIHGGRLNTSEPGVEFWSIIDKNKNSKVWKHQITEVAVSMTISGNYKEQYYLGATWADPEELFWDKESALSYTFDKIRKECE